MAAKTFLLIGLFIILILLNAASARKRGRKESPCKDKRADCPKLKQRGFCDRVKGTLNKWMCPRSCGVCPFFENRKQEGKRTKKVSAKIKRSKVKRCTKSDLSNCAAKKKINACNNAKAYMKKRCPRTCGFCVGSAKKPRKKERKVKKETTKVKRCTKSDKNTCAGLKKHNACNSSKRYMKKYCARTCGFCVGSAKKPRTVKKETTKPCKEKHRTCQHYGIKLGGCTKNPVFYKRACPRTCGYCADKKNKPRTVKKGAIEVKQCTKVDKKDCLRWKVHGGCNKFKKHMRKYCPRTCGFCVGSPKQPRSANKCKDGKRQCARWAKRGDCRSRKDKKYMRKHCRHSCGFCAKKG